MSEAQTGSKNPNWRGGRTITEHGYTLVRLPGHPMADVRGYVYEHRLVASQMLGRILRSDEPVHHKNEIKSDNRPENLEVCQSIAHHALEHRVTPGLRLPGEANPQVACECGCGELFLRYDDEGRPRRFVSGHNPPLASPTTDAIMLCLSSGPKYRQDIIKAVGRGVQATAVCLSKLKRLGKVKNAAGVWEKVT